MTKDEALKLALEALEEHVQPYYRHDNQYFAAIEALRQALDHVPDTTKMIEPDMGIDRGAWDDVPYATKWVDELRGGDEPWDTTDMAHRTGGLSMEQEPVATLDDLEQEIYENTRQFVSRDVMEWMLKRYYTAPPKREWVGLTVEDRYKAIRPLYNSDENAQLAVEHSNDEYEAIEAKLKEKNT